MATSTQAVNGNVFGNTTATTLPIKKSALDDVPNQINELKELYKCFEETTGAFIRQKTVLLNRLNTILSNFFGKKYSYESTGNLPIETIFDECTLNIGCSAGKKAYIYYLKEVLQKLNQLNQHIIKGQEAFNALASCTTESQIKNFQTTLEMQSKFVENSLYEFSKYTVIQTLETTRQTLRKSLNREEITSNSTNSIETNYEIKQKNILNDDFKSIVPDTLAGLRTLKTTKESGNQSIITILTNSKTNAITDLNDKCGVNVITKNTNISTTNSSPIALFDELTLLDKLKYIIVYYKDTSAAHYFYPNDAKNGIPCTSKDELKTYIPDKDANDTNKNELQALGIIPSDENAPKTDNIEVGAIELFYTGYLEDSMGAINALAKFMEIKAVALMNQITQQSYRIKALKAYLSMLEFGFQALNNSYNVEKISPKVYLALKYAAANQTRTLINIDGTDYIVVQLDGTTKDNHQLSNNNRYIFVKATPEGINAFLEQKIATRSTDVGTLATKPTNIDCFFYENIIKKNFSELTIDQIKSKKFYYEVGKDIEKTENGITFYTNLNTCEIIGPTAKLPDNFSIIGEGEMLEKSESSNGTTTIHRYYHYKNCLKEENEIKESLFAQPIKKTIQYYYKTEAATNNNLIFVKIDSNDKAINFLPKELETPKIKIEDLTGDIHGLSWQNTIPNNKNIKTDVIWPQIVDMWQNKCQTAIENIGNQIDSVNKTIKSLRSKVDTFDASSNRFRDKFYTTTMTIINKIS